MWLTCSQLPSDASFHLTSVEEVKVHVFPFQTCQSHKFLLKVCSFWVLDGWPLVFTACYTFTCSGGPHPSVCLLFFLSFFIYNLTPPTTTTTLATTPISPSSSALHELFRGPPLSSLPTCHSMFYSHISQTDLPSSGLVLRWPQRHRSQISSQGLLDPLYERRPRFLISWK